MKQNVRTGESKDLNIYKAVGRIRGENFDVKIQIQSYTVVHGGCSTPVLVIDVHQAGNEIKELRAIALC